jgi:transcriptional regulator of aromatic amino acid metabolism
MMPAIRWRTRPAAEAATDVAARLSRASSDAREEWAILSRWHPNVLFEGVAAISEAAISELTPHLNGPIQCWTSGQPLSESGGTLIVREVGLLDSVEQRSLLRAIDECAGRGDALQVIATTSTPLYSAVERAAFRPDLYYRLNVVRLDLVEQ